MMDIVTVAPGLVVQQVFFSRTKYPRLTCIRLIVDVACTKV